MERGVAHSVELVGEPHEAEREVCMESWPYMDHVGVGAEKGTAWFKKKERRKERKRGKREREQQERKERKKARREKERKEREKERREREREERVREREERERENRWKLVTKLERKQKDATTRSYSI